MGHPRRYYKHGDVCLVTNRLSEGLPFVPNAYINCIIYGALARASGLHPDIIICAFEFLQNHYHLVVLIRSDELDMKSFLHDLDDELAKIVKKLLGKRNVKVWAQRPHVATLGDAQAVIEYISYCFLNAVGANFCDKASDWIGVHSYRHLLKAEPETHKWVPTRKLSRLPNSAFSRKSVRRLCLRWENVSGKSFELNVQPFAWKSRFKDTRKLSDAELCKQVLERIAKGENQCRRERKQAKSQIADHEQLALQNPYKHYKPKKYGRRVYCICTDPELRKRMIEIYQAFCATCAAVWAAWKRGDLSATYPPGAFIPSRAPLCSVLPEGT